MIFDNCLWTEDDLELYTLGSLYPTWLVKFQNFPICLISYYENNPILSTYVIKRYDYLSNELVSYYFSSKNEVIKEILSWLNTKENNG